MSVRRPPSDPWPRDWTSKLSRPNARVSESATGWERVRQAGTREGVTEGWRGHPHVATGSVERTERGRLDSGLHPGVHTSRP